MLCHQRTASLCIYCVRRWVLSFYFFCCVPHPHPKPLTPPPTPLPFLFFVDVEIVSALCSFSGDQWVGLCLGEWERRCGGTVCASRIERDEMPARVGRTCGLVRVLGSPVVSAFSRLSNLSSLLKQCETSKCSEYLYSSFIPSLLVSDSMWMPCLSECSVLSSSPPFLCVKMWCYVAVCVGWETLKVSLRVSSEADVVNVWQVPIERLCLKCWRMHFLCFVTRREVWNKKWLWLGITHSLQWFVCLFYFVLTSLLLNMPTL